VVANASIQHIAVGRYSQAKNEKITLIDLNILEKQFLKIIEDKISVKEFESWLYENQKSISNEVSSGLYEELILINYNSTESKHNLSKLLKIDFEKLELYQIQQQIIDGIENQDANIQMVKYELDVYELDFISYDFVIGGIAFRMHNPFKIENFVNLNNTKREKIFTNLFGNGAHFLNSIIRSIDSKYFRIYNFKKHEQIDRMTDTKIIQTKHDEYKIRINGHLCYIKKDYINNEMKGAWLSQEK